MAFDPHANLIEVTVTVAPSPASSGTTLSISDSDAAALDAAGLNPNTNGAFNASVAPSAARTSINTEIIRLTAKGSSTSGNTQYTITRQTESGGVNRSIVVGDVIKVTITKKTLTDIESYTGKPPQGHLINGKVVTSVATNNLTVAIKTLTGNDPSASDPVYVRIGNTVRTLTAALSITKNAGTNWMNAGNAAFATKEIDYFVYLGYNSTDGITLGFSRLPYGRTYGDFNTTSTDDRYCAISNIAHAAGTDEYENIGRFNAILSASASYNWSIPSTSVIVNRPSFETKWLDWTPVWDGYSVNPTINIARYRVSGNKCDFQLYCSANGTSGGANATRNQIESPLTIALSWVGGINGYGVDNNSILTTALGVTYNGNSHTIQFSPTLAQGYTGWTGSGSKSLNIQGWFIV